LLPFFIKARFKKSSTDNTFFGRRVGDENESGWWQPSMYYNNINYSLYKEKGGKDPVFPATLLPPLFPTKAIISGGHFAKE